MTEPGGPGGRGEPGGPGEGEPRGAREQAIRAEVRRWISEHWDPELPLATWRELLADSGWACPGWTICGRSLAPDLAAAATSELAAARVPGLPEGVGMSLVAPVLLEHGSDDLQARFIRPTVTGQITWCQLFSEPGAGSDLAGLTTTAKLDGDEWIVTGQKVWSTGAATADYGLLLARTDWDVPKHRGITAFVLPMRQEARREEAQREEARRQEAQRQEAQREAGSPHDRVVVRPLRQMNGHQSFNEVFFDEARVPAANLIAEPGAGWRVALTTLAHERRLAAHRLPKAEYPGRAWREAVAERTAAAEPHKWYPQRAGRPDLLIPQAQAQGRNTDPVVRQQIARLTEATRSARWTAERAAAERAAGRKPGPEGSIGKLASSDIARQAALAHGSIAGASGLLAGPDAPLNGTIAEILVSVPGISIAGGTDEVQHTIIGERILGLPREPDVSKDIPFRQVRR